MRRIAIREPINPKNHNTFEPPIIVKLINTLSFITVKRTSVINTELSIKITNFNVALINLLLKLLYVLFC